MISKEQQFIKKLFPASYCYEADYEDDNKLRFKVSDFAGREGMDIAESSSESRAWKKAAKKYGYKG